jgi:hypothetical protein
MFRKDSVSKPDPSNVFIDRLTVTEQLYVHRVELRLFQLPKLNPAQPVRETVCLDESRVVSVLD